MMTAQGQAPHSAATPALLGLGRLIQSVSKTDLSFIQSQSPVVFLTILKTRIGKVNFIPRNFVNTKIPVAERKLYLRYLSESE